MGFFRLGKRTTGLIEFNDQTTMLDIYGHICQQFNDIIPSKFHIEFYAVEEKKLFHLDGDMLKSKNNPFLFDPTNNIQNNESVVDWVELFIVDDSPAVDQIKSRSSMHDSL